MYCINFVHPRYEKNCSSTIKHSESLCNFDKFELSIIHKSHIGAALSSLMRVVRVLELSNWMKYVPKSINFHRCSTVQWIRSWLPHVNRVVNIRIISTRHNENSQKCVYFLASHSATFCLRAAFFWNIFYIQQLLFYSCNAQPYQSSH